MRLSVCLLPVALFVPSIRAVGQITGSSFPSKVTAGQPAPLMIKGKPGDTVSATVSDGTIDHPTAVLDAKGKATFTVTFATPGPQDVRISDPANRATLPPIFVEVDAPSLEIAGGNGAAGKPNPPPPPPPPPPPAGQCAAFNTADMDNSQPVPSIDAAAGGDPFVHGKVPQGAAPLAPGDRVQVCVGKYPAGGPVFIGADGTFSADPGGSLSPGQQIAAQFISATGVFGVPGKTVIVGQPSCAKALAAKPSDLVALSVDSAGNVSGSVSDTMSGTNVAAGSVDVCIKDAKALTIPVDKSGDFSGGPLTLAADDSIVAYYTKAPGAYTGASSPVPVTAGPLLVGPAPPRGCSGKFTDCHWGYSVIGGIEQSDLSSQNSQTNGFADFLVRGPSMSSVYAWGQVRFLGAPNTSNTSNIVSAVSDPAGNVSSAAISSVGFAIDYVGGGEFDPKRWRPGNGKYTFGIVAGLGATTPLSAQSPTVAYAVPAYGTNECTELLLRLSSAYGYSSPLPGSNTITTTTTMTSGATTTTTTSTSPTYCSVNPIPTSTIAKNTVTGVVTTIATSGTQITNIAYAPQDRSNFLLKYYGGIRLVDRILFDKTQGGCYSTKTSPGIDNCTRAITDLLIGQDESITGGVLHRVVFRANVTYPVRAGVYFYGSASLRAAPNVNLDPIILTPTPISTGAAAAATGAVTVPSPNVYVFPLRQSDRDFYRIGIALDISSILPKLFNPSTK